MAGYAIFLKSMKGNMLGMSFYQVSKFRGIQEDQLLLGWHMFKMVYIGRLMSSTLPILYHLLQVLITIGGHLESFFMFAFDFHHVGASVEASA